MILTGLVGLSLLAMIFALLMPSSVKISRGVIIDADSMRVEQILMDADKWNEWVPWLHKKTGLLIQQKGEKGTEGFEMRWQSVEGENAGRITYRGKQPGTLFFNYEFNDMNRSEGGFRIRKTGEGRTEVQWFMEYPLKWHPWERFYGIFVDGMIGSVFESGLQELIKLAGVSETPNT